MLTFITRLCLLFLYLFGCQCLGNSFCHAQTWTPFDLPWNEAPVNLSSFLDAPAGKHGFVDIKDGHFVFEDGTPIRFWGVSITGSACFPAHDQSPVIAERLARFGINIVRFQHLDAGWASPSLFTLSPRQTLRLDAAAFDRLDYFLFQLQNRGIYACLDGLDSRIVQTGDGVIYPEAIPPGWGNYIHFVPALRFLHKDFLQEFWTHRSPYTKKEYRDTPSIALANLFYEQDVQAFESIHPAFLPDLEEFWSRWCKQQEISPAPTLNLQKPDPQVRQFLNNLVKNSSLDMLSFLRSIGVKCPIGSSDTLQTMEEMALQNAMNFTSVHRLWEPPIGNTPLYSTKSLVRMDPQKSSTLFSELAVTKIKNKPLIVSKWGHPWPNTYRAELPIWMAAMANFQQWNGCITSSYSSLTDQDVSSIIAPLEHFNDPCFMGLLPAASILFHANEEFQPDPSITIALDENRLYSSPPLHPDEVLPSRSVHQALIQSEFTTATAGGKIVDPTEPITPQKPEKKKTAKTSYIHDSDRALVIINTEQTQAFIGNIANSVPSDLPHCEIHTEDEFAVFCLSSLDQTPIPSSQHLLVTLVSQSNNTGFDSQEQEGVHFMTSKGVGPVVLKPRRIRLFIKTRHKNAHIVPIMGNGDNLDAVPFQIQDGLLSFLAGQHGTMYYRITFNESNTIMPKP
jgi:hypothetical protein